MSSLDSMAKDMSELLLDNIDKKKMYLASVARKMRYLLVKRKDHYHSYERLFNELLNAEDKLMGEVEKRHGI
jgi:uncharacterized iron-regulated protein